MGGYRYTLNNYVYFTPTEIVSNAARLAEVFYELKQASIYLTNLELMSIIIDEKLEFYV